MAVTTMTAFPIYADDARTERRQKAQERLQDVDPNGDGVITKSEFMAHATKEAEQRFNKADANGDGQLTKDELAAIREKFQQRRSRLGSNN